MTTQIIYKAREIGSSDWKEGFQYYATGSRYDARCELHTYWKIGDMSYDTGHDGRPIEYEIQKMTERG